MIYTIVRITQDKHIKYIYVLNMLTMKYYNAVKFQPYNVHGFPIDGTRRVPP